MRGAMKLKDGLDDMQEDEKEDGAKQVRGIAKLFLGARLKWWE